MDDNKEVSEEEKAIQEILGYDLNPSIRNADISVSLRFDYVLAILRRLTAQALAPRNLSYQ